MPSPEILHPDDWVENHADYLFHYAVTRVNDKELAEDMVQETFVAAWRAKDKFRGNAKERTWLTSIIKRKVIDHYRKTGSGKKELLVGNFFQDEGDDKPGTWKAEHIPENPIFADSDIKNQELRGALQQCIAKLPDKHRTAFILKNVESLETEQLCKELDVTTSNLWVILHRARVLLRECLNKNWYK